MVVVMIHDPVDCLTTVWNDLLWNIIHSEKDILNDFNRILCTGIVRGDNAEIRKFGSNFSHLWTLGWVAVSATAEYNDHPATLLTP